MLLVLRLRWRSSEEEEEEEEEEELLSLSQGELVAVSAVSAWPRGEWQVQHQKQWHQLRCVWIQEGGRRHGWSSW